jgi:peptide/nickel transport system ATP-binding protein
MTVVETPQAPARTAALRVDELEVAYIVRGVPREVLRGVSFEVAPGEAYGLVGESGCGKSTTAYAALRYLPANGRITGGHVYVDGHDVTRMSSRDLRQLRATRASMVYQDPGSSLNPVLKVGPQVIECFTLLGKSKSEAAELSKAALRHVRIADPDRVMQRYPHQLSGGMQQRVVIAMALACNPRLLVLDEPTTGLDATVEAEVLDLVRALRTETDAAILLIAHNLGVIRTMCDRVGVMYAGKVVEEGQSHGVFDEPRHPYTVGLLNCLPRHGVRKDEQLLATIPGTLPQIGTPLPTCVFVDRCQLATDICRTEVAPVVQLTPTRFTRCHHADQVAALAEVDRSTTVVSSDSHRVVLEMRDVSKTFKQQRSSVPALVGVDLGLEEGETLGLVGESGSGKSTLAKTLLGIHAPDRGGEVAIEGHNVAGTTNNRSTDERRAVQMIFQNPDSALNRNWTVRRILKRAVKKLTGLKGAEADRRVDELAESLRLTQRHLDLKPRQLSGGLKQRVAIARAFAGDPRVVVCDEPTSALDVSVQAAILNVLADLQAGDRTSYLFISHDLGVVRYLSDRIAVMYLGRIMELGTTDQIFDGPNHPYTEALLSAVPSVDGERKQRIPLSGEIPSPANPPSGCVFHTRCHRVIAGLCDTVEPATIELAEGHLSKCHLDADQLRQPVVIDDPLPMVEAVPVDEPA